MKQSVEKAFRTSVENHASSIIYFPLYQPMSLRKLFDSLQLGKTVIFFHLIEAQLSLHILWKSQFCFICKSLHNFLLRIKVSSFDLSFEWLWNLFGSLVNRQNKIFYMSWFLYLYESYFYLFSKNYVLSYHTTKFKDSIFKLQ